MNFSESTVSTAPGQLGNKQILLFQFQCLFPSSCLKVGKDLLKKHFGYFTPDHQDFPGDFIGGNVIFKDKTQRKF